MRQQTSRRARASTDRRSTRVTQSLLSLAALLTVGAGHAEAPPAQLAAIVPSVSRLPVGQGVEAIPNPAVLEQRGARIGQVFVVVDDIFNEDDPAENRAVYRLANRLHPTTRETVVRAQLLFDEGQPYSQQRLDETARLLRQQRYINDIAVRPVSYHDDNTVDVEVRVRDVWTLSPGFSVGRKGGVNRTRVEIEDTNLFGTGKHLSLGHSSDVDRTSWLASYNDHNVLGGRWQLGLDYAQSSDGATKGVRVERPFYSLDSRWSAGIALLDDERRVPRYALGREVDELALTRREFTLFGGDSHGLKDGWVRRWSYGVTYSDHRFDALPGQLSVPDGRKLVYPWVGLSLIEDAYRTDRNRDQIGRVEDVFMGRSLDLKLGFATSAFGSDRDALVFEASGHAGYELARDQELSFDSTLAGRVEQGGLADTWLEGTAAYHWRQSDKQLFYAAVTAATAERLDPERQLTLGGDSGLRGFPLRYQAGTSKVVFTAEQRYFTAWQPFRLFNVGAAAFADVGRAWGSDPVSPPPDGWLADVGVGLRLGNLRSGLGNVLHLDIAMPLNGPADLKNLQFLVETRKSF